MPTRDSFISQQTSRFGRAFQHIPVQVIVQPGDQKITLQVHPPYMLQSTRLIEQPDAFRKLKASHRARLQRVRAARAAADPHTRQFLAQYTHDPQGKDRLLTSGRAELSELQQLLQALVEHPQVPIAPGRQAPTGPNLRRWLKTYGFGIDCSGFVQQALQHLVNASRRESASPVTNPQHTVPFLRCGWVYKELTGSQPDAKQRFDPLPTPAQARPGDILTNTHHMRIIAGIQRGTDDSLIFTLAESTAARDVPQGGRFPEADIGPRFIQVQYPQPNQPIGRQRPAGKPLLSHDFEPLEAERTYLIGRYRALDRLWQSV